MKIKFGDVKIGQRWRYHTSFCDLILEVVETPATEQGGYKAIIVQVIHDSFRRMVGETQLCFFDYYQFYTCLEGQDKPQ